MFRRSALLVLCSLTLVLACEKKEAEKRPTPGRPPTVVRAPAGMAALDDSASVFIARRPVAVAQYVGYLEAIGLPVPERWQDVAPGTAEAQMPVLGLTRAEADRYAAWAMKRLPTEQEWRQAASVIGVMPYPWPDEQAASRPSGELYLIQDWLPGTDGETAARQKKTEVLREIAAGYADEVARLRQMLQDQVDKNATGRDRRWDQLKPAFFALLDKGKALAEARSRLEGRAYALEVLKKLAQEKGKVAAALATTDPTPEQADAAVKTYEAALADARSKVQEVRDQIQTAIQENQEQVLALTRALEAAGVRGAGEQFAAARTVLVQTAGEIRSVAEAIEMQTMLQEALKAPEKPAPAIERMPAIEQIRQRMAEADRELAELPQQDPSAAQIEEVQQKLARFSEVIKREFLDEKVLCQELDDLVELRARREAAESRLKGLKEVLPDAPAGATR